MYQCSSNWSEGMSKLEPSYYYYDSLFEVQCTIDAMIMLKMLTEAEIDIVNEPMDFHSRHRDSDEVFIDCIRKIFRSVKLEWSMIEGGYQVSRYRIPFKPLEIVYSFLLEDTREIYIQKLTEILQVRVDDFYFSSDTSMNGEITKHCIFITITHGAGIYSPLLERILELWKTINETIRTMRQEMINILKRMLITKWSQIQGLAVDFTDDQSWEDVLIKVNELLLQSKGLKVSFEELVDWSNDSSLISDSPKPEEAA